MNPTPEHSAPGQGPAQPLGETSGNRPSTRFFALFRRPRLRTSRGPDEGRLLATRAGLEDRIFKLVGLAMLTVVFLFLVVLILDLMIMGLPRIDWDFLTSYPSRRASQAGILPPLVGSFLVMLTTATLAVPLGVAAALYLEEMAPNNRFTRLIEINLTNLAAVPSIIYGLLALGIFVRGLGLGESIITAGLALALLILPVIVTATREALRTVPPSLREAAFALGADQRQTIMTVVLPIARPGILTGVVVGLARAAGETAPLITIGAITFIAFLPPPPIGPDFPFVSFEWLESPYSVLPIQMFNWVSRPQAAFHVNAAAAGSILLLLTAMMNGIAVWIRILARRRIKTSGL